MRQEFYGNAQSQSLSHDPTEIDDELVLVTELQSSTWEVRHEYRKLDCENAGGR